MYKDIRKIILCNFTTITHVIKTTSIYNPCMTIMY